jgi:beta-N-acetylhexosaminidase
VGAAIVVTAMVAATLAASASGRGTRQHPFSVPAGPAFARPAGPPASGAERAWITRTIAGMSLREEVGQLFEINGYGESVNGTNPAMVALNRKYYGVRTIAQLIRRYHPGGIIYFNWSNDLAKPSQVRRLSNGIQRVALTHGARVPMVISTDQEGGEVERIDAPGTVFPGNMPLGATRSVREARQAGRIAGVELRAMGINVDNAPVVDVNVNPLNQADGIRAYGDRPSLVSKLGGAQVSGYQTAQATVGVGATAKHWPGFGDAPINSDTGIAVSPQTLSQVKRTNLPSFRAAIRAGVDRIMVTHILFPKVTGNRIPTSLSRFWVHGLLRRYLHWHGPVVTDALDAAALDGFTPQQVALRALRAGDDELLEIAQTPTDKAPADLVKAYPAVLHAVRSGAISKARLDLSVSRILALKWRLGLVNHALATPDRIHRVVGTPAHLAAAQRVANGSITLLRNSAGVLPLHTTPGQTVLVTGFGQVTTATLGTDLAAHGLVPQVLDTGSTPTNQQIAQAVSAAATNDLIVVTTFNAWSAPSQLTLVNDLLATGKPVVVAAVGTPYDVAYLPAAPTFITGYGYQPVTLHALVKAMFGQLPLTGRLPVTIRRPPPSTDVLYPFGFRLAIP